MTFGDFMLTNCDYQIKTTFWDDFSIADIFGVTAIKDTFQRAFNEWWELYYGSELRSVAVCKKGIVSVYGFSDDENKKAKEIILSILLYLK